ncbi:hypothetical protein QFC21_002713 [Naganishia friedmannii]|uniref:Uncharacterized protein n=1 Tax=Naganishia friedmannii TaxID=89922 RepID=A0ACC2VWP6_9TREE|nr:hypothetical protein QFC21_002713 [Naganishia friedmannii]
MTAPLPTTSFGSGSSPRHTSGGREVQSLSSPLKRAFVGGQQGSSEQDTEGTGEDKGRPVKKLKQEVQEEQDVGQGLVTRLFKYAWHFVGGALQGTSLFSTINVLPRAQIPSPFHHEERIQTSAAAIESDKLQILRKMLDKEEIVVPAYNPTIDLTAESDHDADEDEYDQTSTPRDKKSSRDIKGKGKPMTTPGMNSFRPHGSIFQNEINLPDDDPSSRYSTRPWHSPKTQIRGQRTSITATQTPSQTYTSRRPLLGMSLSRTPLRNGTPRGLISPTPGATPAWRAGQSVSSLTSSMARLNSARNGSVVPSVSATADNGEKQWRGLSARQKENLDRIVPKFEGKKEEEEASSPVSLTDGGEAYRQLLNTFRAAEGVGERSTFSLSTLELAKAWSQAGLDRSTSDLQKTVNTISSVKTKPSKQEKWLNRQREIGQKAYEEAKARDETSKEIARELERLNIEDTKIREEALAKARARALAKIEVPALTPEQIQEVTRTLSNPGFKSKCDREEVSCRDLELLGPKKWLNDEIINFYGAMLMERAEKEGKRKVHFFNSFFFSKMAKDGYEKSKIGRWTKKIDIFAKDIVIFPINQNNVHWVCGAINMKDKRFEFYDSMSTVPNTKAFSVMRDYLQKEHMDKKKKPIDLSDWEDYSDPTLEHRARGVGDKGDDVNESAAWEFEQKHMIDIRLLMQWELIHAQLAKRGQSGD